MYNDIKNSNGKIIGNVEITHDNIIVNTFAKVNKIIIPIEVLSNDNIFKLLYDEYYLSIAEIAAILHISYYAANKLYKTSNCKTAKNVNRRNRAYDTPVSKTQSIKMSESLKGRVSPTKGITVSDSTKRKISNSLSNTYINNPELVNNGYGYVGYFNSIKFNTKFTFRSLLELYVLIKYEHDDSIITLESEPFRIPYELNGHMRNYVPDLLINSFILVEIKPSRFLQYRPHLADEFRAKCKYAIKYCKENGFTFKLVFDSDINYNAYEFKKFLKSEINNYSIIFNKSVSWLSD